MLPDLRYMDEQTHRIFQGIVLGGAYKEKGTVSFSHVLDSEGAEAIHAYLIKRGHDAIEERRLLAEQSQAIAPPPAAKAFGPSKRPALRRAFFWC